MRVPELFKLSNIRPKLFPPFTKLPLFCGEFLVDFEPVRVLSLTQLCEIVEVIGTRVGFYELF